MFPTDYDFRRYAIAQATAKRIATQIAQQIEPGMTESGTWSGALGTLGNCLERYPEGALMRLQRCITARSLCAVLSAGTTPHIDTLAVPQIHVDGLV